MAINNCVYPTNLTSYIFFMSTGAPVDAPPKKKKKTAPTSAMIPEGRS